MNKRGFLFGVALWLCLLFVAPPTMAADNKLEIAVSQSQVLNIDGVKRVAIANPEIADVLVVSDSELLLVGKTPGITTLQIWTGREPTTYLVEVDGDAVPIGNKMKGIAGFNNVKVSKVNKTVILEGTVSDQYQKVRAEKLAEAYGEKVVNLLELTNPFQVKIEAKIVEIDREKTKKLGIMWGNGTDAPGSFAFGQGITNTNLGNAQWGSLGSYADINATLNTLITNGSAKILSQPNMITLSGNKASILVGGQMPVPISNNNGQISIEWKDYGIKLEIEPEVNAYGLISSKVKAEVSSIDWNSAHAIPISTNGAEIPPIKTRRAESVIVLSSAQTMAIGGLISSEITKDVQKIPLLGDLPIIGSLFRSSSFSNNETELLIFVTPTIVDPTEYVPQATMEMKKELEKDPWGDVGDGKKNKGNNSR